ncbi:unnamed protein product [Dibothriocephalus latus]|uniref:protein phosphatase methylesterase-1 n=1 Tax=Dibothriocephalus latus TaxID=60516 RepID=A0A3P7NZ14_DIBLA|nr:unnamed protein product [Dibothriocephalus latus]
MSNHHKSASYQPCKWSKYFNIRDDIEIESGTFRIYRRGVEGPLLFFIHGGGFSALSWALLSSAMTREVRCQCLAVDMRGHGDTHCHDESDLSIETLTSDIIKIIFAMFPTEAPPIVLIGHSMGGAVAVHVAQKRAIPSLAALVVVDVVEDDVDFRTGQVRNLESARVSFPGQLRRMSTGETATCELDRGVACIDVNPHGPPKTESSDDHRSLSAVPESSDMEATSEHSFSTADVKVDMSAHDLPPPAAGSIADSIVSNRIPLLCNNLSVY